MLNKTIKKLNKKTSKNHRSFGKERNKKVKRKRKEES